jgi:AcrR family transcriptional regulator
VSSVRSTDEETAATRRQDGRHAELRGTARERLLDAAAAEFVEHGYRATSVQAIARRAGLTRGAVYWNFESKQELFLALLDERLGEPARELMQITETAPDESSAARVGCGLESLIESQAPFMMLLFEHWAAAVREPDLRAAYTQRQAQLRDALARAITERHDNAGVALTYPAQSIATGILALAHGIAMDRLIEDPAASEELFDDLLDLIYDGLVHRASAQPA